MLHHLLPHTISSDVCEGVQIKLSPLYQPLHPACRSRGNGGQGTAVVIRRDVKSLLTLEVHCNIILLDMIRCLPVNVPTLYIQTDLYRGTRA